MEPEQKKKRASLDDIVEECVEIAADIDGYFDDFDW